MSTKKYPQPHSLEKIIPDEETARRIHFGMKKEGELTPLLDRAFAVEERNESPSYTQPQHESDMKYYVFADSGALSWPHGQMIVNAVMADSIDTSGLQTSMWGELGDDFWKNISAVRAANPSDPMIAVIARQAFVASFMKLSGFDGSYGQKAYVRPFWRPSDDEQFLDVLEYFGIGEGNIKRISNANGMPLARYAFSQARSLRADEYFRKKNELGHIIIPGNDVAECIHFVRQRVSY